MSTFFLLFHILFVLSSLCCLCVVETLESELSAERAELLLLRETHTVGFGDFVCVCVSASLYICSMRHRSCTLIVFSGHLHLLQKLEQEKENVVQELDQHQRGGFALANEQTRELESSLLTLRQELEEEKRKTARLV
jgi:hypothetical protein